MPNQRQPVILAVDDDELILAALRAFFTIETEYQLLTASSAAEALAVVSKQPVDLVLSDFLMPETNGVEFLKQVRDLQPDAPRILLTGFADKENAIRGINDAGLYYYLEKPWSNDHLLLVIRNALSQSDLRRRLTSKARELDRLIHEHQNLRDRHQGLERELEMAARVQRSLLPAELPQMPPLTIAGCYEPSELLGGDFFDVHHGDQGCTLLIADVSGHGPPAALAASLLKAVFHEATDECSDPQSLLGEMNRRLSRFLPSGLYAVAAAARLDGPHVELASAGIPHPRVLRASGAVETIALTGTPLALLPEAESNAYDARTVELQPGDTLLLATDGLGEVRNRADEQFEDVKLPQVMADGAADPRALLDRLLAAARDHGDFRDDVTALALGYPRLDA